MKVGIVGSGIAGLSAAWLLTLRGNEVHLYEKQESLGLGAHSISVGSHGDEVDVPIRFFHELFYPQMLSLLNYVGIETMAATLSPSIQVFGQSCHYKLRNLNIGGYAIPYVTPWDFVKNAHTYWTIWRDSLRFKKASTHMQNNQDVRCSLQHMSLAQYLVDNGYSTLFIDMFLVPLFAVVSTSSAQDVRNYPITVVMDYINTLMLTGKSTRRMTLGTKTAGDMIAKNVKEKHVGVKVQYIKPNHDENGKLLSVAIHADGLPVVDFDHVIIATQANQAVKLVPNARADHVKTLSSFKYVWSEMVVHSDERLMPLDKSNWTIGNFFIQPNCPETKRRKASPHYTPNGQEEQHGDLQGIQIKSGLDIRDFNKDGLCDCSPGGAIMCTVWQNISQPLNMDKCGDGFPVFQTWNPWVQPRQDKILPNGYHYFERPVVTVETEKALENLKAIQGQDNVWYIGAYSLPGVPLLENAANSGLMIAERLTGQSRPWKVHPIGQTKQNKAGKLGSLILLVLLGVVLCSVLYSRL
ncbi:uncharacterized protein LOC5514463 isoform X2 [Nematostella vectensis]|nr:uncharacterized protein LOC5514463 isoform X2 [Nematostella vectensis]